MFAERLLSTGLGSFPHLLVCGGIEHTLRKRKYSNVMSKSKYFPPYTSYSWNLLIGGFLYAGKLAIKVLTLCERAEDVISFLRISCSTPVQGPKIIRAIRARFVVSRVESYFERAIFSRTKY